MNRLGLLGLLIYLTGRVAAAEILLDRTRLIYLSSERDVSVTLTNSADSPRLVQAWIDAGDAQVLPEYSDVPFTVTPPILRVDPGKGQVLRITLISAPVLPTESVYWLNVLSIRPTPAAEAGNVLQWAFRTRIKVFLRTAQRPEHDEPGLRWQLSTTVPALLEVHNPSAYHVTLSRVTLIDRGREYRSDAPPMIGPDTTLAVPLNDVLITPLGQATLRFSILDDHGITQDYEERL